MFKWYVTFVLLTEIAVITALALYKPGVLALALSPIVLVTVLIALLWRVRSNSVAYRIRRLSPEDITSYEGAAPVTPSTENLSRSIVERATEIQNILSPNTSSEITIEMCAMGYRACVNDMITLSHLINEELPQSNVIRRLTLRRARRKATEALSGAREALPPGALRATHQEQQ